MTTAHRQKFASIKQGTATELRELQALRDEIYADMKAEAILRDEAMKDFEALPLADVNSMIAKAAKKEDNQRHAMNYTSLWRVWMDVKGAIEVLEPTNQVYEGQLSFGF